ncbi:hypothetical protein Tco_1294870 [Tanacetum coccineum]
MTGNKSFLTDYQEVDGRFVAFVGSPNGGCQFLGKRLISWQCKKQTIVANSTTEAEYVAATNCYETVIKEWEDRMERAATTYSSLEVEQESGNINRTQSMATLNESFPQGIDSGSGPRCQDTILGGAEAQTRLNLLLPVLVYAAKHTLTAVRHMLMLPAITCYYWKPEESNGFEEIIDFLNTSSVQYALTVNPTIYTTCIEQFWTYAKAKTVNGERQIQALVDKKKVIITETSIRSDLKLDDAEGTYCLPTATIFAELERMGTMASAIICLATNKNFNFSKYIFDIMVKNLEGGVKFLMYPRFVQVFLDKQVEGMSRHIGIYVIPSHTKKVFANIKRPGKGFSEKVTPLFETMIVQATEDMGEDSAAPTDSHSTPIHTQPSSSRPQKKKSRRKQRKDIGPTEPIPDEAINKEHVATPSCDPPQSGEDRILKRGVKSLEKKRKSRTPGFKRLRKEKEVTEKEVSAADLVTTAGEVVTTANVEVTTANAPTTTIDELTLAQTLIEIKAAKPKAVTSAATTTTTTRPKARGVVVQEPSEFKTTSSPLQASQLPQAKEKGKAKMVEPEKPLKKKDQIAMDEEVDRNLEAQLQAELEEEERISRLKEEKANIALLESWDNTQAMMDADFQLAQQMQTEEQEQLSIEEKSKLFVELLEKRKKHFATLRAQEKRRKPPNKAQKRNIMSTYLKNMARYKHNQMKSKSYDEIQEMFDKEMKRVNTFVDMNTKLVKNKEGKMKKHIEIVKDDELAIDAIPLSTKPPVIVKYNIVKEGKFVYFQLIRADGSSKRYLSMIKMLQNINREDLETL